MTCMLFLSSLVFFVSLPRRYFLLCVSFLPHVRVGTHGGGGGKRGSKCEERKGLHLPPSLPVRSVLRPLWGFISRVNYDDPSQSRWTPPLALTCWRNSARSFPPPSPFSFFSREGRKSGISPLPSLFSRALSREEKCRPSSSSSSMQPRAERGTRRGRKESLHTV